MEGFAIVVEDDGFIEPDLFGLAIEYRDRLDKRHLPCGRGSGLGKVVAHPHGFYDSGARQNSLRGEDLAIFKFHCGDIFLIDV